MGKVLGKLIEKAKEDPLKAISATTGITGVSLATANLLTNKQRVKDANKNQKEQLNAMKNLTNALTNVNTTMKDKKIVTINKPDDSSAPKSEGFFARFRRKNFSIESGGYQGGKRKTYEFSPGLVAGMGAVGAGVGAFAGMHDQGGPAQGAAIGSLLAAGVTALASYLYKVADESEFKAPNSHLSTIHLLDVIDTYYHEDAMDIEDEYGYESPTTTETTSSSHHYGGGSYTSYTSPYSSYNSGHSNNYGHDYNNTTTTTSGKVTSKSKVTTHTRDRYVVPFCVDGKPNSFTVNMTLRFGVLVMYVNNPIRQELQIINDALDSYCHYFQNADYTAKTLCKNGYQVELQVVGGDDISYIYSLVDKVIAPMLWGGIRVNFITGNTIFERKGGAKFKRKDFSLSDDMIRGAGIGGGVGTLSGIVSRAADGGRGNLGRALVFMGAGSIVGAALGALHHAIKKGSDISNRRATVDARLMTSVVDDLKASGFKEGVHFTRDPKKADELKSRVSIVISRSSGEMNLIINMVADDRLKDLTKDMITRLPNSSAVTTKMEDKYNEITITTIEDNSANAGLVAGICNYFIRSKYPVYLVEVG